jgi:formylglycine-generating enzyme required for sulfatase activity
VVWDIAIGIGINILTRVAGRQINSVINNFTKNQQTPNKNRSNPENNREFKKAELTYYKKKLDLDNQALQLQRQQQREENEIARARLGLESRSLELREIEIAIEKERLNLSVARLDLLREQQEKEIELKLKEIQAEWDKDTWFSRLSRFETEQILKKYRQTLLILASLPSVAGDRSLSAMRELDFKMEMRTVGDFLATNYPPDDQLYPVKFFSDYFKQPIEEIDIERLHSLLSSVPVYIIYTDIRASVVTFRVASWNIQDDRAIPQPPIEWNWREVAQKLSAEGKSEDEILSIVRAVIIKIHQVLLAFYTDLYYLGIDPYYEIRLPEIEIETELIQPYSDRLKTLQGEIREAYEQELANRLEEERRVEEEKRRREAEKGKEFSFEIITVDHLGNIAERRPGKGIQKSENLGANINLEMVYIPGGTFLMGSPDGEGHDYEKPQHRVTVPPFYLGKYPITQAQWRFIASQPKIDLDLSPDPSNFKGDNRPVERVNWYQAVEFCKRLSKLMGKEYNLPSESQWEYACRAGTTTPFAFGATLSTEVANYDGNHTYANGKKGTYRRETTPVGQFPPNAFGLYDMHGNVWEWCEDDWHDNYNGATEDGSVWIVKNDNRSQFPKCMRGGSWYVNPNNCRSASRNGVNPGSDFSFDGFRVACVSPGL